MTTEEEQEVERYTVSIQSYSDTYLANVLRRRVEKWTKYGKGASSASTSELAQAHIRAIELEQCRRFVERL